MKTDCDYLYLQILQFAIMGSGLYVSESNAKMISDVQQEIRRRMELLLNKDTYNSCEDKPSSHGIDCACGCGQKIRHNHLSY